MDKDKITNKLLLIKDLSEDLKKQLRFKVNIFEHDQNIKRLIDEILEELDK